MKYVNNKKNIDVFIYFGVALMMIVTRSGGFGRRGLGRGGFGRVVVSQRCLTGWKLSLCPLIRERPYSGVK